MVPKPVKVRQKARVEVPSIGVAKRTDISTTAVGQWAGGPPRDKKGVVVDECSVGLDVR